jgi:hypothetical protein
MFDSVSPDHLMIPGSLADLRRLPDEITVWRGGADISVRKLGNGMSWTLKPATAIWFARHLVPYFAKNPLCIRDPGQGRMKQSPSHSSFDAVPSLVAFAAFKFQPPGPFAPPGDVALPGH